MFGTRKLIIKGLTAGGRLGPPSIPLGYASLHYERAQPMTLANDLKVFNFRWQSGVQFWVAVHNSLISKKEFFARIDEARKSIAEGKGTSISGKEELDSLLASL